MNQFSIIPPETAERVEAASLGSIVNLGFVNEAGQVSSGQIDYQPGMFIAPHRHHTWELILVGPGSASAGYVWAQEQWWKAPPGSHVFLPKGMVHAWSCGNQAGFVMLWIYGGSREEAGRIYVGDPEAFRPITAEQQREARIWQPERSTRPPACEN